MLGVWVGGSHSVGDLYEGRQHQTEDHGLGQLEAADAAEGPGAEVEEEVRLALHLRGATQRDPSPRSQI